MRTIFIDASAWIAIIYEKDKHHNTAAKIYGKEIGNSNIITSNWTAYEAYSYVKSKTDIQKAIALRRILENRRLVRIERVTKKIEQEALDKFWSYQDKKWGIVDITSFEIMEKFNCDFAIGFDRHFVEAARQGGFRLINSI